MGIRIRIVIILLMVVIAAVIVWTVVRAKFTCKIRNVVLISIDTCRADHLSCYGYSRDTTPNIDAVARDGILFKHAVTPVPLTLPAHSSMLTGTTPLRHKVRDNSNYQLSESNITLAEVLRQNGFHTGAAVGAFVMDSQFGMDQGFDTYDDDISEKNAKAFMYNERSAEKVSRFAETWLKEHHEDKFFLFLHYFDPHAIYKAHRRFLFFSRPSVFTPIDRYDSEIAYTDHYVGRVISILNKLNLYDSTLLIITSDHGESFGEHSEKSHGFFIYYSTLHIPMIIKLPEGPKARQVDDVVSLIDIVPTVCGALGIKTPAPVQGKDLKPYFHKKPAQEPQRDLICETLLPTKFELGPFFGLINDRWHYIHSSEPELFEFKLDPYETKNSLAQHAGQGRLMYDKIKLILQSSIRENIKDSKIEIDDETVSRLESLGYVSDRKVDESIQLDEKSLDPKEFIEMYNFFDKFLALGAANKNDEARQLINDMLAKRPDMKQGHFFLGMLAVQENDTEAIITHLSNYLASVESEPGDAEIWTTRDHSSAMAHALLGRALLDKGQITEAVGHYKEGLSVQPELAAAHSDLGGAYVLLGEYELAIKHLTKTLELKPNFVEALNNLAWLHAADKDSLFHKPAKAVELAEKACKLSDYRRPDCLDTLSVAYASVGRLDDAIETAKKAISFAEHADQQKLAEEIKGHLASFENGRL